MAIDWIPKFTKNPNGHYSATFRRIDTIAPDVTLETINILDAILDTPEQKAKLWDKVWANHEEESSNNTVIAALETEAKTVLLAKESKEK